jgi:hypothetical protein
MHELSFISGGTKLRGTFFDAKPDDWAAPLVIILTGDGSKGSKSDTWGPVTRTLNEAGISAFIFDFHGLGLSEGSKSELSLTRGITNFLDALKCLRDNVDLSRRKIGALGSSFGGAVVLSSLQDIPPFDAIVLKSPASFLPEAYENEHGSFEEMSKWRQSKISARSGLNYEAYLDAINHNIYRNVHLAQCPVLIIHGDVDSTVPIRQSKRLAFLIGSNATLVEVKGGDHDYKQPGAMETLLQETKSFFERTLR